MINPAYSGINNVFNATLISRAQWLGINGAPVTNSFHASSSFLKNKMGAGMMIVNDKLGVSSTTEFNVSLNYRLLFLNSKLSFGIQAGTVNFRYDYSKLNTEVVDQVITRARADFSKPNIGAGIFYKAEKFYVGVSVPRLLDVTVQDGVSSSTRYKRHVYLSAGYLVDFFNGLKFKPSVLVRAVENVPPTIDLNMQVLLLEVVWAGLTTRNFSTIGLVSQIEIGEAFRAGYLFELPIGSLQSNNIGSHELMVSIDLGILKSQVRNRRYF